MGTFKQMHFILTAIRTYLVKVFANISRPVRRSTVLHEPMPISDGKWHLGVIQQGRKVLLQKPQVPRAV